MIHSVFLRVCLVAFLFLQLGQFVLSGTSYAVQSFPEMWDHAMPVMSKGMDLIAKGGDPDKRSWGEILTFRDPKFQRLLADCFKILADSETMDLLEHRDAVQKKIQKKRVRIVELQKDMISAPDEHWNPMKATKSRIKSSIAGLKEEIRGLEQQLEQEKEAAVATISSRGIPITREQVDALLSAADGEDTASIMAVAENIKKIQQKIEEVVQSPDSSIELLKTYTGVYMMCHKVYTYAISHALEQIAQVYLKRLGEIQKEATELLQSARHMMNGASSSDRSILETNVQTNQRTLDAVSFYAQYLKRKRAQLERLHAKAEKSANVAVNTYRTVKTSTELLRMMRSSQNEFTQIFNFEPPSVALMYDERLKGEFEQITARLRGE